MRIELIIFFCILATIVVWWITSGKEKDSGNSTEEKKDSDDSTGKRKGPKKWYDTIKEEASLSIILLIAAYAIVLITSSRAFPKMWELYWASNLFWLSQIAIILSFWLFALKSYGRAMAIAIWILLLTIVSYSNWPDGPPKGTGQESSYVQIQKTTNGVISVKVVAYPGEWIRKEVPHGYDWMSDRDPKYGLENANRLLWVRIDEGTPKDEGLRKDGSTAVAVFTIPADYVRFMSGEKEPVYLVYSLMKRR